MTLPTALWAAPTAAEGPAYFYCYAQDPATRTVYVSDVQAVGPVSERAAYGTEFSRFLSGNGKVPSGTLAYCTMHMSRDQVERGVAGLTQYCSGCADPSGFAEVAWPRGGKTLANLLAAKLPGRTSAPTEPAAAENAPAEGIGVFALGRIDETDVVFTANEDNGQTLSRYKADLRGGKWTTLLSNDRCSGWLAIAYASNSTDRAYFVSKGAADEGAASGRALEAAEKYAERQGADWTAGVLFAFVNNYQAPGFNLSDGVLDAVKKEVRAIVTTDCDAKEKDMTAVGVRG